MGKVSMKHPHFPDDTVFGLEGVGQLTNDNTPVDVDDAEFEARMGMPLNEYLAGAAVLELDGAAVPAANPPEEAETESGNGDNGGESPAPESPAPVFTPTPPPDEGGEVTDG